MNEFGSPSVEFNQWGGLHRNMLAQPSLFPLRISNRYPLLANGNDLSSCCGTSEGMAYCKEDKDGRLIRATEWFCTSIADHLGIVTPRFAVIEDPANGQTLFGSLQIDSPASVFDTRHFLNTPRFGELGQPSEWPGAYLSGIYALDMFLGNGDRGSNNFLLMQDGMMRRLCAFDYASSTLDGLDGREFPDAQSSTVSYGRFLRHRHRFFDPQASEMIDRIAAIPSETIAGFLKPMPKDWMSAEQREKMCELWSARRFGGRLLALRTGIADGTLL